MKNVIPFALFTFDRLEFKAPPADIFEDLLGYSGTQRFIGFCYTGQALCIEDGSTHEIGYRAPWAIWYRSLGAKVLRHHCFGYEGRDPEHLLILDRKSRILYAAPVQAGQDALAQQVSIEIQKTGATPSGVHRENEAEDLAASLFGSTSSRNNQIYEKERIQRLKGWVASRY